MKVLYVDTVYECSVTNEVEFENTKDLILNGSVDGDKSGNLTEMLQDYVDNGDGPDLTVDDHLDELISIVDRNINKAEYPNHKGYYSWDAIYDLCLDAVDEIRGEDSLSIFDFEDDELDIVEDYLDGNQSSTDEDQSG